MKRVQEVIKRICVVLSILVLGLFIFLVIAVGMANSFQDLLLWFLIVPITGIWVIYFALIYILKGGVGDK